MKQYLDKYTYRRRLIEASPPKELGIVVVIPCYNETELNQTLVSLQSCSRPPCHVEVIVVVNQTDTTPLHIIKTNEKAFDEVKRWEGRTTGMRDHGFSVYGIFEEALPKKHAGVGFARKIGMDEAVRRFDDIQREDGIIACFDADSTCSPNYLTELYDHFKRYPHTPGCAIKFEHPTFGTEFEPKTYLAITYYELHLRYYNQAIKATGVPYAFHTVGSSMAVRASAYQKQGGMNRRKAGEDFYFLHKIIELGNFTELNSTVVYPSPRPSDRVPFGTGKAVNAYLTNGQSGYYTYNLQAFRYLSDFFQNIPEFYITKPELVTLGGQIPYVMMDFLSAYFFDDRIVEIYSNSKGLSSFEKRFYRWFNAFMVLKFVHFVRDNAHPNVRVELAALDLLRNIGYPAVEKIGSVGELLEIYRQLDRGESPVPVKFLTTKNPE
ncbi:MAG: glycosyltransferase [Flavobacteriales bacterium]|nr:glycosyltransferase [Flavobacteriales bacterium]